MKDVDIGDFILKFEKVYGSILDNRQLFVKTYNTYLDSGGWRTKVQVGQRKEFGLVEPIYQYQYTKWGKWDWEAYEHFVRIPNHTRIQTGEGITGKYIKAVSMLPKNVIHKVLTHE